MTGCCRALRRRRALVAALISAPSLSPAFAVAQSDVAFPPAVYAARRARLLERTAGAPVVIAGRYLINPGDELAKQDPDFWYLTGVESPYAILVLTRTERGAPLATLFLPAATQFAGGQYPMDEPRFRDAPWNRPRHRLAPDNAALAATGVDHVYAVADFAGRFRELAGGAPVIYAPEGAGCTAN